MEETTKQGPTPKRPRLGGFCSAASYLEIEKTASEQVSALRPVSPVDALEIKNDASVRVEALPVVGWPHYQHLHSSKPGPGAIVRFKREPDNEHDANAIAAFRENTKVGYVSRNVSSQLAPLLDTGRLSKEGTITKSFEKSFQVSIEGLSKDPDAPFLAFHRTVEQNAADSNTRAEKDVERAVAASYTLQELNSLPWTAIPEWTQSSDSLPYPFDASIQNKPPITLQDVKESTSWPPSDDVLLRLGMAPISYKTWWRDVAGLRSPLEWNVSGALDVLPHSSVSSTQKRLASQTLDGAIHGVTNVWHDDTLDDMKRTMHEPDFWCRRSGDALIRAFGGPYVLGQHDEKLKLIHGAPHTELTKRMCLAHNLVYTAIHLVPPVAPGFNTLIFGCNLRGAGFHYHQDAIGELKAKNGPLVSRQPVVTTVFYERPEQDQEKEVVLWKPCLNFSTSFSSSGGDGCYDAARAVSTTHGMVHVQQAGLQKRAVHGIFHAPKHTEERRGYRVAITARITKPNAAEIVQEFVRKSAYCAEFGPEGDLQLESSS